VRRYNGTYILGNLIHGPLCISNEVDPIQSPDHSKRDLCSGDIHHREAIPGRGVIGRILQDACNQAGDQP
jgi:hypothetical protein